MRVIGEVPHNQFKITLFQWNGKFIIKIESGMYEQTYKVDEYEIPETSLPDLLDESFMSAVSARFREMHMNFQEALNNY